MLFNSFPFIIFFAIVAAVYYPLRNSSSKKIFILIASYLFYCYWDYRFCFLMLLVTTIDFFIGKNIAIVQSQQTKKRLLLISVICNLGVLTFFKYFNFFIDSFNSVFSITGNKLDFLHINVILPLGISFYIFKSLSYTIDIYREKIEPAHSFTDYAIFISFFPQLTAGPIDRPGTFLPQLKNLKSPTVRQVKEGFYLVTIGMLKKVLIGDAAGKIADQVFAQPGNYASSELLMGVILFSIQIYADFSGYSAISRGVAKFLGIETMENFNLPYLASNITEFWRRWHISLTTWFRDYLFTPLSFSLRDHRTGIYISIFVTFLVSGLWHGANWTFIAWGGIHALFLMAENFLLRLKGKKIRLPDFFKLVAGIIFTNIIVTAAWLLFRAESFSQAMFIAAKIFSWQAGAYDGRIFLITFTFVSFSFLIDIFEYYNNKGAYQQHLKPEYKIGFSLVTWIIIFIYIYSGAPAPFIYSQF